MKFYFDTLGNICEDNKYETTVIQKFFKKNNILSTNRPSEADFILLGVCGAERVKEIDSIKLIKSYLKFINNKKIILYGCLGNLRKYFNKIPNVILISVKDIDKFDKIVNSKISIENISVNKIINATYPDAFFIKVSQGCMGNCSFCVIKKDRGKLKSRPINDIVKEFKDGIRRGYKKFILFADDLGCYGFDIGASLVELLKKICKQDGDYKIILNYVEPGLFLKFYSELKDIFKADKIYSINVPIQSGNNRILELMNRNYKIGKVLSVIRECKKSFPKIILCTDIIIGFPTETRDEFYDSIKATNLFDSSSFTIYGDRDGTASYLIEPKVGYNEIRERIKILSQLKSKKIYLGNIIGG